MRRVSHNALTRIDQRRIQSPSGERLADDLAREKLAVRGDVVGCARSQFSDSSDSS
jgi:hypothetical protein